MKRKGPDIEVMGPDLILVVRPPGFEPGAFGFVGVTLEFHNLLKLFQLIDMEDILFLTSFPSLVNFSRFWKDFLTRILTQKNVRVTCFSYFW